MNIKTKISTWDLIKLTSFCTAQDIINQTKTTHRLGDNICKWCNDRRLISKIFKLSRSHVYMCELDHKEGWALKNWCFQTVVLEKTLESPLDSKENKPVNLKRNQPWIFVWKTDAEAPILLPPDAKNQLIVKDPDAAKDWGPEWRGWQRMRRLDGLFDSMDVSISKLREMVKDREARCVAVDGVTKSWKWLSNETITCRGSQRNVIVRGDYNWGLISVSSVQSLSRVPLFVTVWTVARQASLSITNSQNLFKLMSIESAMPSNHLISVMPFSSHLQSFPASGSFPVSQFFKSDGQSIGVSALASVLPMNIQDWFPLRLICWISLQSQELSRVLSNTTVQKHQYFGAQLSF